MSFDMNMVSTRNLSNIQASAKSQDGGAGNTGYFMRDDEENTGFHFKDTGPDYFDKGEKTVEQEEEISLSKIILRFIEKLIDKITAFFSALKKR